MLFRVTMRSGLDFVPALEITFSPSSRWRVCVNLLNCQNELGMGDNVT